MIKNNMPSYIVPKSLAVMSARDFLQKHAGISLNLWRKIKHHDKFYINGQKAHPTTACVIPNDEISYTIEETTSITAVKLPLDICYEDDYLLITNKPAGQLVHPTTKERMNSLANAVLYHYKQTKQDCIFHPVHRLDRNTSGLVLIAKLPQIQHQLSNQNNKRFHRIYKAIIEGTLIPSSGTINAPIDRKAGSIIERIVLASGKEAITHYRTLQTSDKLSLLRIELDTGRTHQIRVHLAYLSHPLLGDDLYGGNHDILNRQALHACQISFFHPITNKLVDISCPLPPDMTRIVSSF